MRTYTTAKNEYSISIDIALLDIAIIHDYLSKNSYWAKDIPVETVQRAIEHSFCFGLYHQGKQIGFARLITDYATYAYLADVFILPAHRGKNLSKWLIKFIVENKEVQGLRRWVLATKDAHGLYAQFGFKPYDNPDSLMQLHNPDVYQKKQ